MPWAINSVSTFCNTFDNSNDKSRRKAKSVLRTIPNSYEDDTIEGSRDFEYHQLTKKHSFNNSFYTPQKAYE